MFSNIFVILSAISAAMAAVSVTSPIATTSFAAGQQSTITWRDDGSAPSVSSFGPSKISIYAGNSQQQTLLQSLSTNTDVSQVTQLSFTPDATIGPNSSQYFIRFESLSLMDANQPTIPALAFSAKFTLTGMTGTFSDAVQAQINGQSTAPLAGPTAAGPTTTPAAAGPATTTTSKVTITSGTSTVKSGTPTSTVKSSAMSVRVCWGAAALSALVGLAAL